MSERINYIDFEETLMVYEKTIDTSGGGFSGIRDEGGIKSVLDFVQNDLYYPEFIDKLAYLVFGFCTGHYFNDGNKRIALTIGSYFLYKNRKYWAACVFMQRLEMIVYHIAAGNIDKDLFRGLVKQVVNGKDFTEEQKLALVHSIGDKSIGVNE